MSDARVSCSCVPRMTFHDMQDVSASSGSCTGCINPLYIQTYRCFGHVRVQRSCINMCIYMYVCLYLYMYRCTCLHIYTYMYIYIYIYIYIYVYIYIYMCVCVSVYLCIYVYICIHDCMNI